MRAWSNGVNVEMRKGGGRANLSGMAAAAQPRPELLHESPEMRETRMAWERARLAEADADFAAGRYISGDEAVRWLENEIAEAEAAAAREAD